MVEALEWYSRSPPPLSSRSIAWLPVAEPVVAGTIDPDAPTDRLDHQ